MNVRRRPTWWLGVVSGALAVLLAACGGGTAVRPTPTPTSATPNPNPPPGLFAALQASRDGNPPVEDTILIVGRDGRVSARATFAPRSVPWILPDLGPILPGIAHVANGRAYYIDGSGVVRSLGWTGDVRQETRFPLTSSQQVASFVVSPDGRTLVGSVVTFPPRPNPAPTPPYTPPEAYSMDVMVASAGGAATVTYHQEWRYGNPWSSGAQFVTWDVGGPVAVYPTALGTQGGAPRHYFGSTLVHFPNGRPGAAVPAPAQSQIQDLLPDGTFVTSTAAGLQARAADGTVLWSRPNPSGQGGYLYSFLAPGGQHVVTLTPDTAAVLGADGTTAELAGMAHFGWLDARTVIGGSPNGQTRLVYASLDNLSKVVDTGFDGYFVASVS